MRWSARAQTEAQWLAARGIDVVAPARSALALGPQPNAYRRIRRGVHGGLQLAVKEWRVRFEMADDARERALTVTSIHSGYRPREIFESEPVFVSEVGPVIGAHVGPGLLGVGAVPRDVLR